MKRGLRYKLARRKKAQNNEVQQQLARMNKEDMRIALEMLGDRGTLLNYDPMDQADMERAITQALEHGDLKLEDFYFE